MKVKTTRFGEMEVEDSNIIKMLRGPLGFEDYTEFCLIQHRPDIKLSWLQSTQEESLAFVVVDPSEFVSNYEIEICDADTERLNLECADDALVLSIVTVNNQDMRVTTNLAAPIVINSKELCGLQIVLQDNRYSVKHTLFENSQQEVEEKTALEAA